MQINYSVFSWSRLDNSHVCLMPLSCNTFDFKPLRRWDSNGEIKKRSEICIAADTLLCKQFGCRPKR